MYVVRPFKPNVDSDFVFNATLKSLKYASNSSSIVPSSIYYSTHSKLLNEVLNHPTTRIAVASPAEASDVILGYLITLRLRERPIIYYCYVKADFRGIGIARAMFEHMKLSPNDCDFPFITQDVRKGRFWAYTSSLAKYPGLKHKQEIMEELWILHRQALTKHVSDMAS